MAQRVQICAAGEQTNRRRAVLGRRKGQAVGEGGSRGKVVGVGDEGGGSGSGSGSEAGNTIER